ncbi:putative dual-specificity RNA methyltransferase RlmN [bioreactor metagenome]|uniref:Putative dual-specificity RNA methyltransferase RlmN n=1 Tax=bioreactor metagenome TaxID=1076179 RepID=A0A644YE71_9ZZZZ
MRELLDIRSMTSHEVEELVLSLGQPKYRAAQIYSWVAKGAASFDEMSNVPTVVREKLKELCRLSPLKVLERQKSGDGTVKYLFELYDGNTIESVLMRYEHGTTLCVSSQVGCRMGCSFCASTVGGLVRNLSAGEMLEQVQAAAKDSGERVDGLVLMGMGEPLDNYDNVIKFLHLVNDSKGCGIGFRHISLSTCGIVPMIDKLAEEGLPITLSISLHAPTDAVRASMMPVTRKWSVGEVVAAAARYEKRTGRKVYFEYTMVAGVNDSREQAQQLAALLNGMLCHVNLIPLNPVQGKENVASDRKRIYAFSDTLTKNKISSTVRRRLGTDIDAACGQLRRRRMTENS